jgi:molybdopterin-guanine dinucleotide biosynthesis protein A/RimJ/RimL family protein N-acetyltransferase
VAPAELTGILLVGGASTRFGSTKALAQFEGSTLAERAGHTLGEVADELIAVGKRGEVDLPFAVLDDGSNVRAPMVGVVAGLRAARSEMAVVMPIDMPFITARDLRELADRCADAAIPHSGPLPCALRRAFALPVLERRLAKNDLALHAALAELRTTTVAIEPAHLLNVNTPDDLRDAEVAIVPLRDEHAAAFGALVTETHREYGFGYDAQLDADLDDPVGHFVAAWVALQGDEVVGSVALRRLHAREVELKRMYLRPEQRGRGIGQRLLDMALLWAREHRIDRIILDTTEAMAAARRLYERNGFVRFAGTAERQDRELLLYERRL